MQERQYIQQQYESYATALQERFQRGVLAELQPLHQWVVWRREEANGQPKKVPYAPQGYHASVRKPQSWGTLPQALDALTSGKYNGLGFMLTESDPFCLLDLDHAYSRETGQIATPQAQDLVTRLASYTEASPTDGIHILVKAALPGKGIKTGIEMYDRGRFSTITTRVLAGTTIHIAEQQIAIEAIYREYQPQQTPQESPRTAVRRVGAITETRDNTRSDAEVLVAAIEAPNNELFQELWEGRWTDNRRYFSQGQPDQSRADFQLVKYLLYWTGEANIPAGKPHPQTDRLFRKSHLMRDKWDDNTNSGGKGHTYGELTIFNALH